MWEEWGEIKSCLFVWRECVRICFCFPPCRGTWQTGAPAFVPPLPAGAAATLHPPRCRGPRNARLCANRSGAQGWGGGTKITPNVPLLEGEGRGAGKLRPGFGERKVKVAGGGCCGGCAGLCTPDPDGTSVSGGFAPRELLEPGEDKSSRWWHFGARVRGGGIVGEF